MNLVWKALIETKGMQLLADKYISPKNPHPLLECVKVLPFVYLLRKDSFLSKYVLPKISTVNDNDNDNDIDGIMTMKEDFPEPDT